MFFDYDSQLLEVIKRKEIKMKVNILYCLLSGIFVSGCATHLRSLTLGGASGVAIGAFTGSAARYGDNPSSQVTNTLIGAGLGLGIGLLASHLLHVNVEERISSNQYEEDERIRFGDLPPNPFSPANQINPQYKRK